MAAVLRVAFKRQARAWRSLLPATLTGLAAPLLLVALAGIHFFRQAHA